MKRYPSTFAEHSSYGATLRLLERAGVTDAEGLLQQGADPVGQGFGRVGVAPGIPFHRGQELLSRAHHALQYYI